MRESFFEVSTAKPTIVMFGDSLTERGEWAELLPGMSVANRGIGGDTTELMLTRVAPVIALKPDYIFLMAGINDLIAGSDSQRLLERYLQLIAALRSSGARVVVQSTLYVANPRWTKLNPLVSAINARLERYCASGLCTYLDVNQKLSEHEMLLGKYTGDGIHLTGSGYLEWKQLLLSEIPGKQTEKDVQLEHDSLR